jgi:glycosyltransferase 2 family protein
MRPFAVFASAGDEERRRRSADVLTLVTASLVVLAAALESRDPTEFGDSVTRLLTSLPDWVDTLLAGVFALSAVYVFVLIVVTLVARDRPGLVRDLLVAAAATILLATLLSRVVEGSWPSFQGVFDGGGPRFPVLRVALVASVVMTASPHVVRPMRRLGYAAIASSGAAAIALEFGATADVVGAFGMGLGIAALVHIAWGSPAGAPSLFRVRSELRRLGLVVAEFTELPSARGELRLACTDEAGRPLVVKVYGRDAADTQLLAKAWRYLWYRHGGEALTITRREQVEHEALVTLLAQRAGITTSDLVTTGMTASGDRLLVVAPRFAGSGRRVELGPEHLDAAWTQLGALHEARIAHGQLDHEHVAGAADGGVALEGWAMASCEASEAMLLADLAALLVLSVIVAGQERAIDTAARHAGSETLARAIPYVQSPVLPSTLRDTVKRTDVDLAAIRAAAADAAGAPGLELVQVQRVRWQQLLMTAITTLAIYFVISKLIDIGLDTIVDSLKGVAWGWLLLALAVGQLPRFSDALSTQGACDERLPYGPTVALEMSLSFINLAVPSTAARVSMKVRYYQKRGIAAAKALTFGALDSMSLFITQMAILVLTLGVGSATLDLTPDTSAASDAAKKLGIIVVIAVVAGLLTLVLVRRIRRWVWNLLTQARDALRGIGSIQRWGLLFGGNLLTQILFSVTLGLCVLAFGHHVSFVDLLAINVVVSLFAGLMPVPGGIGVSEGATTACLVAVGIPQADALSAVLAYRMVTFYLPPLWGYFTLRWLRTHDYL